MQSVTPEPVVKLAPEIKHLTNLLKMVAYQAESDLVRAVAPHYRRVEDEGRTLIQSAFASAADLEVTDDGAARHARAAEFAASHAAPSPRCATNSTNPTPVFPGSRLRLRYAIHTRGLREKRTFSTALCQEFWIDQPPPQSISGL